MFVLRGPGNGVILQVCRHDPASVIQEHGPEQELKHIFYSYSHSHSCNPVNESGPGLGGFSIGKYLVNIEVAGKTSEN